MSSLDVLRATFPAGTLSGAPKIRAMEIIDELEPVKRGIYGGAVGYLSFAGDMDVAISIRTGIVKDQVLYVQAAAGVVADSVPEMEWRETEAKARAMIRAAGIGPLRPNTLVLSPGPCSPAEGGVCIAAIEAFTGRLPILGVCLGHQAIGAALGGQVVRAKTQMHGKTDVITTDERGVYTDLPREFTVIRYHSLVIARDMLPRSLEITSTSQDGEIMGVRH